MKIFEFGDSSKRTIILVHGFQSPWQIWEKYIAHYEKEFHIIVPVITGHDPDKKEEFTSFEDEAKAIEDYILEKYGDRIYAVFGMSMGGVLTATMWQNKRLRFEKVIFDGSPLTSMNPLLRAYMRSFYLKVTHKSQQRDRKTLDRAAGTIVPKENLEDFLKVLDNMSDQTIINSINGIAGFKLKKDTETPDTEVFYFHGTASNEMLAKKTAKFLKKHQPGAEIKVFEGKGHCENSLLHPETMIKELDRILKQQPK